MKKFLVFVRYEGSVSYSVDAMNEEDAKREASRLFGEEDDLAMLCAGINDFEYECVTTHGGKNEEQHT